MPEHRPMIDCQVGLRAQRHLTPRKPTQSPVTALASNAQLQSQLDNQSAYMYARSLEEKVVSQGQTASALCIEVDRISKENEELGERLAMQMEQRRIETDQFRQHLAIFKATKNGHIKPQPNNFAVQPPRILMTGNPTPSL